MRKKLFLYVCAVSLAAGVFFQTTYATECIDGQTEDCVDTQFYSGNDILYLDPSAGTCASAPITGGDGPSSVNVGKDFTLGTDKATRPVKLLKQLMQDFNLQDFQAAGVVGNFMHESGVKDLPPNVNEGGQAGPPSFSGGYGWAQWTGGRQVAFIDFAVNNGYIASKSVSANDAANYAYLTHELTQTAEKQVIPELKTTKNSDDAAFTWQKVFERAGIPHQDIRNQYAKDVLQAFKNGTGVGVSGSTSDQTQTNGCPSQTSTGVGTDQSANFGQVAFPLKGTQSVVKNPGMFHDGTADRGGHPYIAYDILANTGTEVVAFASGTVTYTSSDRCGGKFLTIWNDQAKLGITYMHLSNHIAKGATVQPGDHVGTVGSAAAGCGTEHLHIDASTDKIRQVCSREGCSIQDHFRDIGKDLFNTFEALPKK